MAAGAPSKQHILYLLSGLISQINPVPPPLTEVQLVNVQAALVLVEEPQANVTRYDDLRSIGHAA